MHGKSAARLAINKTCCYKCRHAALSVDVQDTTTQSPAPLKGILVTGCVAGWYSKMHSCLIGHCHTLTGMTGLGLLHEVTHKWTTPEPGGVTSVSAYEVSAVKK